MTYLSVMMYGQILLYGNIQRASFTMSKLGLDLAYRDMNFARMPDSMTLLVSSLQEMKRHNEAGLNVWNRRRGTKKLVCHDAEALLFYKHTIVSFLFRVLALPTGTLSDTVGEVIVLVKKSKLPETLPEFINDVSLIATMQTNELFQILRRQDKAMNVKITAALALIKLETTKPEELLYASGTVFDGWKRGIYATDVDEDASTVLCRAWRAMADRRFLLKSPNLTAPQILEACESREMEWGKVAKVILAAIPATNLRFPEEMIRQLKMAGADNDGDVTPAE